RPRLARSAAHRRRLRPEILVMAAARAERHQIIRWAEVSGADVNGPKRQRLACHVLLAAARAALAARRRRCSETSANFPSRMFLSPRAVVPTRRATSRGARRDDLIARSSRRTATALR